MSITRPSIIVSQMLRVINKLYYLLTGVRVKEVQKANANAAGVLDAVARLSPELTARGITEAYPGSESDADTAKLGELLGHYGSDKSTKHNYYLAYAALLAGKREKAIAILEIGLGTNDPKMPSNMRGIGKPGGSLRAFRDWAPQAQVFGADVDRTTLFTEDRIATFFVDQTDTSSLQRLAEELPVKQFDLIIDDGLHTPWANLNTLIFALPLLKPGAYFVVEDILGRFLPVWRAALPAIPKGITYELVKERKEFMLIFRNEGSIHA